MADPASKARIIGAGVGLTPLGAWQSAEDAVANLVKTGKRGFSDLVTSPTRAVAARRCAAAYGSAGNVTVTILSRAC